MDKLEKERKMRRILSIDLLWSSENTRFNGLVELSKGLWFMIYIFVACFIKLNSCKQKKNLHVGKVLYPLSSKPIITLRVLLSLWSALVGKCVDHWSEKSLVIIISKGFGLWFTFFMKKKKICMLMKFCIHFQANSSSRFACCFRCAQQLVGKCIETSIGENFGYNYFESFGLWLLHSS